MNVRTIQHPGVELNEIDLTEYFASTPTTTINNAYVMGFTQKGPIYDCSWITSQAEFVAVYGEPKTEAERYLYYAVQSILANGGNAIVSRMPYDNKQCKTYKGLSLTYGTYDGELGVLFECGNEEALKNAMKNMTEHPELVLELKKKTKSYLHKLNWDNIAHSMVEQIERSTDD